MSIQPLPLRSGRREVMAEAQAPITRQLTAEARRRAGRALVRLQDWLFEIGAPLVRCRDDHNLALAHDDLETYHEDLGDDCVCLAKELLEPIRHLHPNVEQAIGFLFDAQQHYEASEVHDQHQRRLVVRADSEVESSQVFVRGLMSKTERGRLRLLPGGPEGAA